MFTNIRGGASGYGELMVLRGYAAAKPADVVNTITPSALDQVVEFAGPSGFWSNFGVRSTSVTDFDEDGCLDVVVGADGGTIGGGGADSGNVLVFRGQTSGANCTGVLGTAPYAVTYGTGGDQLGFTVAGGMNLTLASPEPWRVNGLLSSSSDPAVVAGASMGDGGAGYVALWYGGFTGNVPATAADVTFSGVTGAVDFNWVNFVGDLDGDGYVDIAVGDPGYEPDGRIVLYH